MLKEDIKTLGFYKKNAKQYSHHALIQQEVEIREIFMNMLPHKGTILDFGCGPGYDAYAFSKKKFLVTALDAVNEFSEIARNKFKLELRIECFSQFRDVNLYNGIWASASLVHLPKKSIDEVFSSLCNSLKLNGVMCISFREGEGEARDKNGRLYSYMTQREVEELIDKHCLCLERFFRVASHSFENDSITQLWALSRKF